MLSYNKTEIRKKILELIGNSNYSTKEIAQHIGLSTKMTYQLCRGLEEDGKIYKIGYRVKDGWEDVNYSNHHFNSLNWERTDRQV